VKAYKRLMVVYRAAGSFTLNVKVRIDNFSEQSFALVSNSGAKPLGEFILGTDYLGSSFVLAPESRPIDGYGRGIKITVEQTDSNAPLSVQGLLVEYEGGADQPETRLGDST
jgi:hypothetical protein